jgi:hypothetical protein
LTTGVGGQEDAPCSSKAQVRRGDAHAEKHCFPHTAHEFEAIEGGRWGLRRSMHSSNLTLESTTAARQTRLSSQIVQHE